MSRSLATESRTLLLAGVALLSAVAAACGSEPAEGPALRVLSYNIRHGVGVDGQLDLARIAAVIRSVSPDVVSLQEVDCGTGRSGGIDQAAELARLTELQAVFGSSMEFDGGQYGNAVLTRLAVLQTTVLPLPGEPRSALGVTLQMPGEGRCSEEFLFIATHLDTGSHARVRSVPLIAGLFNASPDRPVVLAGDLNAVPGSATMLAFAGTFRNATEGPPLPTYPVENPSRQIDYILFRPAGTWMVEEVRVLDEKVASDHRPIFAVLRR